MAVLRKRKRNNYTVIDNGIFKNRLLSLKAKGLLCLMLSLPDDWEYSVEGLATLSDDGRVAVSNALKELENMRYFKRVKVYKHGRISGIEYIISEEPMDDSLDAENLLSETMTAEECEQLNTNNNKELKKSITYISQRKTIPPDVEWVEEYCRERNNGIDAQQFMDHYESNGWMVGKNKMKDWQAAVRTWERSRNQSKKQQVDLSYLDDFGKGE